MTVTNSTARAREQERRAKAAAVAREGSKARRRSLTYKVAAAIAAAGVVIGGLFAVYDSSTDTATTASVEADYDVGSPGAGEQAPDFELTSAGGETVTLSDFRGETVLLFFHEGLGCQPCWDQIGDLESEETKLRDAGIDRLVSITSAPADLLAQKMNDDGLQSLALADPDLEAIGRYEANKYGMMGDTRAGHSFLLIGPDSEILWRADYGGAPNYTMWLPVDKVLADLQAGRVDA